MIMDTDTVEARLLAADDERGEVGQRSPNRDPEIDADPRHLTNAPSFASKVGMTPSCILPEFGQRESARRSCLIPKKGTADVSPADTILPDGDSCCHSVSRRRSVRGYAQACRRGAEQLGQWRSRYRPAGGDIPEARPQSRTALYQRGRRDGAGRNLR